MNNKTLLKSRRGISPILATLLLIVIAVAAIVVTYAWIMTYMSSAGHQAGVMLYEANVRFYGDGTKIDVDIGNSGTSDTEILKVYIGASQANLQDVTTSEHQKSLPAGHVVSITLNYNWTSGTTYYFKIVPKAGTPLEFHKKA
ncbi:MAG: archaellin/type IV pilin N-terminal domain-containing protein [Candidatus Bathycorpusculaceae bacterium]